MVKMTMIEDPETYHRNIMFGFKLAQEFSEKEILLECLSDQKFAEYWKNSPSLRKGYEQGLFSISGNSTVDSTHNE
jgi:hypothetical protein